MLLKNVLIFFVNLNNITAMFVDDDILIRERALETIIAARREQRPMNVRVFRKPVRAQINENAKNYYDILKWDTVEGITYVKLFQSC